MDEADRRLLYYLDLNSRAPVGKLAALTGLRPEKVESRLARLQETGTIRRCFPEIDRSKLGYYPFKIYIQFQNLAPEKLNEVYEYLAGLPNAGWVVTCSGRWDMIFAIWARDVEEFNRTYEAFLCRYHKHVLAKVISISVEFFLSNKKWLCEDLAERHVSRVGGVPDTIVDEADLRILRYLGWNGRAPVIGIAGALGIEPSEVEQRIKEMQKKGVILSFRVDMDLEALGRTFCKSFVYLTKSSRDEEDRFLDYCFRHPDVTAIVRCVGPWDLEVEAHSRSFQAFTEMMNEMRNRYPNVVRNFEAVVINRETGMMYAPREGGEGAREGAKAVKAAPRQA